MITEKERNVLERIAQGKTNREISDDLKISLSTAEQYIRILMGKIPSENRAQLVYEALKRGLIQ